MPDTRSRLGDAEVAALARHAFGLGDAVPELPVAEAYEDAQGVPVAVREDGRLAVVEVPRWRSPAGRVVRAPPLVTSVPRPPSGTSWWSGRAPRRRVGGVGV